MSSIHIKKSKQGSLHKHLGVAKNKKIPASKLSIKKGDSLAIRKKKQFAINAKKWKHQEGGVVEGKNVVHTNIPRSHTRLSIYPELVKAGVINADSLSLDQWNRLTPQATLSFMDTAKGFDYTMGNTANPGGIKYWDIKSFPSKARIDTSPYWKEKGNTKYFLGGQVLSGVGGILGAIPTPWTQIAGMGLNLIGGFLGDSEQQKEAEKQKALGIQNASRTANAGLRNPTGITMAYGGLTPYGTPVEVEQGEVMRNPNDGSMAKISEGSPTHAQGGVPVAAEPGTQIFGNLKVKSGRYVGLTYKEAADKIRLQMKKYEV
jgi:hypothetical protein